MRATFRLKNPKAKKETVVFIDVVHEGTRRKVYTDVSVSPKYWRQKDERLKVPQADKDADSSLKDFESDTNSKLSDIAANIRQYPRHCIKNDTQETADGLKAYLEAIRNPGTDLRSYVFLVNYFEHYYLPGCESGVITFLRNNQYMKYTAGTIKSKKGVLHALKAFEADSHRIRFDRVDMNFYTDYLKWSEVKGHKINQTGKVLKEIKTIMRYAHEQGVHNNTAWDNRKFAVLKEAVTSVALTRNELDRLAELSLTGTEKHYRDVFLVGCYTALRVSDYKRISREHIKERDGYMAIEITTQKTKAPVIIPIANEIRAILSDPEFFGRSVIEQRLNKIIKDLCKRASITGTVEMVRNTRGLQSITKCEKYKLVSSHTARRTGATNLYNLHGRTLDVMQITGHKTERAFLNYIKISPEEAAGRMARKIINAGPVKLKVAQ